MRVGAIIFSRMSSKRLPGKSLLELSGKSLLTRVIEASLKIMNIDHVCVATTINTEDDQIEHIARKLGVDVVRGSENDLIQRAIDACNIYRYESFARICGDRPFVDPNIYDELILSHRLSKADVTTNIFPRSVPFGLSAEIVNIKSLKYVNSLKINDSNREHLTQFFYNNSSDFKIINLNHKNTFKQSIKVRLVIDNENDLQKARWIIQNHKKQNYNLSSKSIIKMADKWELNYSKKNLN